MVLETFLGGFNTQPRGGGCNAAAAIANPVVEFQHTAARRRLPILCLIALTKALFQHTAARRRLLSSVISSLRLITVSTHSRAEAAA